MYRTDICKEHFKMFLPYSILTIAALLPCSFVSGKVFDPQFETQLNDFVTATMDCRRVPGMTLAVVKDDEIWTRGYGFADISTSQQVTNDTLFEIGSITKSFTMTLLGTLLTDKGMNWSAKVLDILGPDYGFEGEFRSNEMTLRDMLSHRTGLTRLDLSLLSGITSSISRAQYCMRMKYLPEEKPFRDGFLYNNYMFMILGHVAEKLGGDTWENLVRSKLFGPIGMDSSTFLQKPEDVLTGNVAKPYVFKDGRFQNGTSKMYSLHPLEPAGAIMSSAIDMIKWVKFLIAGGKTESGEQLVDQKLFQEAFHATTPLDPTLKRSFAKPQFPISDTQLGYGYALFSAVYRGYKRTWHSGGMLSYISQMWLYPEKNIGIFASVNGPGFMRLASYALKTTLYYTSDQLLGEEPWLNETTSCTYPKPWQTTPAENSTDEVYVDIDNAADYDGQYGNQYLTDISVAHDPANKQQLNLTMQKLSGILHATTDKDRFLMEITSPWEMMTSYYDQNNVTTKMNATFIREDGKITSVEIAYEVPVMYIKGKSLLDGITNSAHCTRCLTTYAFVCLVLVRVFAQFSIGSSSSE